MSEAFRNRPLPRAGWLLLLLIPASALAVGTLHRTTLLIVSAVAALALVLLWWKPVERLPREARWIVYGGLVLVAFTALQVVPLPEKVVAALAPFNADIWARALTPFGESGPSVHPISVAPTMTYLQLLRGLVYLAVYLATLRLVASDHSMSVERTIILATTVMALLALAHPAVGAQKVLGVYRPRNTNAFVFSHYAPLLNQNHLAAYLNIGFCLGFASLLSSKPAFPRPFLGAATLLLAGTSIWAGSRGGMGGLALAIATVGLLAVWSNGKRSYRGAPLAAAAFVAVGGAILIAIASSDQAQHELASTDLGKLSIAKRALGLALRSPWFGFGRGAFEDVFPRVNLEPRYATYTNPENIAAQWTTEWGFPVSIAAAGVFLWALRPEMALSRVRPAIGAWVAIAVSVAHDLVDFHLEVPGIMIPIAACAALITGRRISSDGGTALRNKVFVLAGALAGAVALVALTSGESLEDDRDRVSKHSIDRSVDAETFRGEVHAAMLRHPSEPFLPLVGAVRAQVMGEGNVVTWTSAALERYPRFGRAHLVIARSLARRNPSQARLEYRLAYEYDYLLRTEVMTEGANLVDGTTSAFELVVEGDDRAHALGLLSAQIVKRLPSTAYVLDTDLLRLRPTSGAVLMHRAEDAVSDLVNDHPWCEAEDCAAAAMKTTEVNLAAQPGLCAPHLLRAKAVAAASKDIAGRRRALDDLVKSLDGVTERAQCQRAMLQLMHELGDERYVETMLQSLVKNGCGSNADCFDLYLWAAHFEEGRGRGVSALSYYKRALLLEPDREEVLNAVLRLATKHGLLGDAQSAADALARLHPGDPQYAASAAALADRIRIQRVTIPVVAPAPTKASKAPKGLP